MDEMFGQSPDEAWEPGEDGEIAADRELQAAIEYKIALDGVAGVERILEYVHLALSRSRCAHACEDEDDFPEPWGTGFRHSH